MVAEDIIISCFLVSGFVLFCFVLSGTAQTRTGQYRSYYSASQLLYEAQGCLHAGWVHHGMSLQKLISCEQALFSGGGRWYKEYSLPLPSPHSPSPILFLHSRVTSSHTSQIIQREKGNFAFSDYRLLTTGPSYLTARFVYWCNSFAPSRALFTWKT